jgi:hypothetical protein
MNEEHYSVEMEVAVALKHIRRVETGQTPAL